MLLINTLASKIYLRPAGKAEGDDFRIRNVSIEVLFVFSTKSYFDWAVVALPRLYRKLTAFLKNLTTVLLSAHPTNPCA